jgi:hypothetical protein
MSIQVTVNGVAVEPLRVVVNKEPASQGNLRALLYEASVNALGALTDLDLETVRSVKIDVQVPAPKPPAPKFPVPKKALRKASRA